MGLSKGTGAYLVASMIVILAYPILEAGGRAVAYSVVSFGALALVLVGLRQIERAARLPWHLLALALVIINIATLIGHADNKTADPVSYLLDAVGNATVLAAAAVLVVRRGRDDVDCLIDSSIVGFAVGGLIWAVIMPPSRAAEASLASRAALFLVLFALTGVLGALLRLARTAAEAAPALEVIAAALTLALAGNIVLALPAPAWVDVVASMMFMVAYTCVGLFALLPSAKRLVEVGPPRPADALSRRRLTFLGIAVVAIPAVIGGQALLGGGVNGLLLIVGSGIVAGLVMIRIGRLSTQREHAERALKHQATHDGLTGLLNRHALLAMLDRDLSRGEPSTILFCDLNGFKPINDNLGHAAGDVLLVEVARRLQASVRDTDIVSRFGGDEFVILLRNARIEDAHAICDRIASALSWPVDLPDASPTVGLSIGIAVAAGDDADHLIGRADGAMYEAKRRQSWVPRVLVAEAAAS